MGRSTAPKIGLYHARVLNGFSDPSENTQTTNATVEMSSWTFFLTFNTRARYAHVPGTRRTKIVQSNQAGAVGSVRTRPARKMYRATTSAGMLFINRSLYSSAFL